MGAARRAQRRAKTLHRAERAGATSSAERMAAGERYTSRMRAAGFEYDPESRRWVRVRAA